MTGERTAEPTSELGQTEKSGRATGKSALPSTTDIVRQAREVRKVPQADMRFTAYGMTSASPMMRPSQR
jgi:hypothetical protein